MKNRGFTLIELLVVISIIALLIGILLPALGAARRTARQMQNSTQLRGIHQSFFAYSQDNKGWYPGIDSKGQPLKGGANSPAHVSNTNTTYRSAGFGVNPNRRYAIMLDSDFFTPEYMLSPGETAPKQEADSSAAGANVALDNYSFALLEIDLQPAGGTWNTANTWTPSLRAREWQDTVSTSAVIMSDRAIADSGAAGNAPATGVVNYHSVWSESGSGQWTGSALRNDGSVGFGNSPSDFTTAYASGQTNQDDSLFVDETTGDLRANARLVHQNNTATLSAE